MEDLARNITLGQYVPGRSVVHRLDPRTKILCWLLLATAMFISRTFVAMAVFLVVILAVNLISGISFAYVWSGLRPMWVFLIVLYCLQVLFSRDLYPESTQIYWQWGWLSITYEGLYFSTLVSIRVVLLYLSVTLLTLSTSLVALTDGAEALMAPFQRFGVPANELAMVAAIAVRFVPTLVEELEKLIKAQTARGAKLDSGNAFRRTRARIPIFVPLFINTLRRAEELIVAMEARCYRGGRTRTKRKQLHLGHLDAYCWAAMLALTALAAYWRWFAPPPF